MINYTMKNQFYVKYKLNQTCILPHCLLEIQLTFIISKGGVVIDSIFPVGGVSLKLLVWKQY